MTTCQFAFYGIDIEEALREVIGGESLTMRTEARRKNIEQDRTY